MNWNMNIAYKMCMCICQEKGKWTLRRKSKLHIKTSSIITVDCVSFCFM